MSTYALRGAACAIVLSLVVIQAVSAAPEPKRRLLVLPLTVAHPTEVRADKAQCEKVREALVAALREDLPSESLAVDLADQEAATSHDKPATISKPLTHAKPASVTTIRAAARAGRAADADYVLAGAYAVRGKSVRFDGRLIAARRNDRAVVPITMAGTIADLVALRQQLVADVRWQVDVLNATPDAARPEDDLDDDDGDDDGDDMDDGEDDDDVRERSRGLGRRGDDDDDDDGEDDDGDDDDDDDFAGDDDDGVLGDDDDLTRAGTPWRPATGGDFYNPTRFAKPFHGGSNTMTGGMGNTMLGGRGAGGNQIKSPYRHEMGPVAPHSMTRGPGNTMKSGPGHSMKSGQRSGSGNSTRGGSGNTAKSGSGNSARGGGAKPAPRAAPRAGAAQAG